VKSPPFSLVEGSPCSFGKKEKQAFHQGLKNWFLCRQRNLPWRINRTPYRVAVSEFMLQQTQVATVLPYYERWMQRFPDWSSLAEARETVVLKAWEGLGYYSRARNLQHLAQAVMERGGELPQDAAALREMPGIGPYTAGAISSLAFGKKAALVDGNVIRVLSRVFNVSEDVSLPRVQKAFWALAEGLLPDENCGAHNEALMELGALTCTPHNPQCLLCPLQSVCRAPEPELLPVKKRAITVEAKETLSVIRRGQKLWCERPSGGKGRLAAFWKLPAFDPQAMTAGRELTRFTYGITKYRVRLTVLEATWKQAPALNGEWLTAAQVQKHSFPAAHRKALKSLPLN
jgi:A/G-specific adenine glycosylase